MSEQPIDQLQPNAAQPAPAAAPVEIVPVGAQRLERVPNRAQRNASFVELGDLKLGEGTVRAYANKRDGSLLLIMPDQTGYLLDTTVVANQCYKYWLLRQQTLATEAIQPTLTEEPTNGE